MPIGLVVIAILHATGCNQARSGEQTGARAKPAPTPAPLEPAPTPNAEPEVSSSFDGWGLLDDFQIDVTESSPRQRARIARVLTRAVRRCMSAAWVCPNDLELEIVVQRGQATGLTLRSAAARPPPQDPAVMPCLEQMLRPLGEVGFARRTQIVFPIGVEEAYRGKSASGCGDDPELPSLADLGFAQRAKLRARALSGPPRAESISMELIRRHLHRAIGHCRGQDLARWESSGVAVIEVWFDPARGSDAPSDQAVVLLSHDALGMREVTGPVLECMTQQAEPLFALAKESGQPLHVTYPMPAHGE